MTGADAQDLFESESDTPRALPALDGDHLALYTAGDPALTREVLALFREQVRAQVAVLTAARDGSGWHDAAHTLKGSARGVGAERLAEICALAEVAGPEAPSAQKLLARIEAETEAALDACDALLAELGA
jgi:HPt (histidine-containing phosphotransfer) domain-containing protein